MTSTRLILIGLSVAGIAILAGFVEICMIAAFRAWREIQRQRRIEAAWGPESPIKIDPKVFYNDSDKEE